MCFYCEVRIVELLLLSENKDTTSEIVSQSTTSDTRVGNTSDAIVARLYHTPKNFPVSRYLYDHAISGQEKCPDRRCHKMCMVTLGMSRCHAQSTTSDARVGNTSDARVCLSVFVYV